MERVWQRDYANHGEARCDIADYIVSFYNCTRLHPTLGYLPAAAYERNGCNLAYRCVCKYLTTTAGERGTEHAAEGASLFALRSWPPASGVKAVNGPIGTGKLHAADTMDEEQEASAPDPAS